MEHVVVGAGLAAVRTVEAGQGLVSGHEWPNAKPPARLPCLRGLT